MNFPLKQVLQRPNASRRLLKWAVQNKIFKARTLVKEQTLVDFVAEFTLIPEMVEEMESAKPPTWNFIVDGSLGDMGSGAGIVLVSPEEHKLNCAIRFERNEI